MRNRGSYMSAHVLLNLLNELEKEIRCEALQWVKKMQMARQTE